MLDKLNFSHSDKLNFPNSDVHTENCLILLLQHVFPAVWRPDFFCGPPDRDANSLGPRGANCCELPWGLGCRCVFPGSIFIRSLGPLSCPCDRSQGSRLAGLQPKPQPVFQSAVSPLPSSSPASSSYEEMSSIPWTLSHWNPVFWGASP